MNGLSPDEREAMKLAIAHRLPEVPPHIINAVLVEQERAGYCAVSGYVLYENGQATFVEPPKVPEITVDPAGQSLDHARAEVDAINTLQTRFTGGGWLSTLVMNVRNSYLAVPDSKIDAISVRRIVEGFLAELASLRSEPSRVQDGR